MRVDIITVNSKDDILKEFQDINRSVPIPICYLTPNDIVDSATRLIEAKFPRCFSKDKSSRPKVNIGDFKSALISANITTVHKLDQNRLYDMICKLNDHYKSMSDIDILNKFGKKNTSERAVLQNCIIKCRTGDFLFIGLFKPDNREWINTLETLF